MEIHIHFRKTGKGYLATVRVVTAQDVAFHRVSLPEGTNPWSMTDALVRQAIVRIKQGAGPGAQVVTMQMPLPAMGR